MKIENLISLYQAHPFRPFVIHTADGEKFLIPRTEFLAFNPEGPLAVAFRTNQTFSVLNLDFVTALEILPGNRKAKRLKGSESLSETAYLLKNRANARRLLAVTKQLESGKGKSRKINLGT